MRLKSGSLVGLTFKRNSVGAKVNNDSGMLFIYLGSLPSKKMCNNERKEKNKLASFHWFLSSSRGAFCVNAKDVNIFSLYVTPTRLKR